MTKNTKLCLEVEEKLDNYLRWTGPNRAPELQSTHPDPENRIKKIRQAIEKYQ